jgi:hypothetical protein
MAKQHSTQSVNIMTWSCCDGIIESHNTNSISRQFLILSLQPPSTVTIAMGKPISPLWLLLSQPLTQHRPTRGECRGECKQPSSSLRDPLNCCGTDRVIRNHCSNILYPMIMRCNNTFLRASKSIFAASKCLQMRRIETCLRGVDPIFT